MKTRNVLFVMMLLISFLSCKKNADEAIDFPPEIDIVKNSLTKSFDTLNSGLAANTSALATLTGDSLTIRNTLIDFYENSSFITESSFIDQDGILEMIEPSEYYGFQGSDISGQAHVVKSFQTKQPVLSQGFELIEGFTAAIVIHPIVNNNQVLGALDCVFYPDVVLGRAILPVVEGQAFEIWVMEKGGVVLFDQDEEEIGLNVITDPLYADFPELIAAAELIDAEESGKTTYSFYQTGTNDLVVKETYWKTIHICDNEWKIIWVIPVQLK